MYLRKIFKTAVLSSTIFASLAMANTQDPTYAVIPRPVFSKQIHGEFSLDRFTHISVPKELRDIGDSFAKSLKLHTGLILSISEHMADYKKIRFEIADVGTKSDEGYTISVREGDIVVKAPTKTGLFYGATTLVQMIDEKNDQLTIPCSDVQDEPRFSWRGLMLDEARHFHGKEFVKHMLDNMALHKMNIFHWHLTDDEGWRIEIKKYPRLTEVGAWRGEGTPMPAVKWRKPQDGKTAKYGGYYTQEDIKEIVAYAAERHIHVLPEIDIPGHVTALITAYPEYLPKVDKSIKPAKGGHNTPSLEALGDMQRGYRHNELDVVQEKTYQLVDDIFKEVTALFPYKYIHIGGDEVLTTHWKHSPEHIEFMKKNNFKEYYQLQNHFMLRMEKILAKYGRTLMGWNEIMKGGELSKDSGVMAWIGIDAGLKAARAGYPTVMAVSPHNYFDMLYPGKGELNAHSWAGPIDSKRAYEWNPLFKDKLTPEEQARVKGVHACVWSEYVPNPSNADYKFWPRAASTAEVGWTPQELRNWNDYSIRFGKHVKFFDNLKTTYRVRPPVVNVDKGYITMEAGIPGYEVHYTVDGSEPTRSNARLYLGEKIPAKYRRTLKAITFRPNRLKSIVIQAERKHFVKWDMPSTVQKPYTYQADISSTIDKAGEWTVYFKPGLHLYPSTVNSITVKKNGQVIATLPKKFNVDRKEQSFDFQIKDYKSSDKFEISINMISIKRGNGKTTGFISVDRK